VLALRLLDLELLATAETTVILQSSTGVSLKPTGDSLKPAGDSPIHGCNQPIS
jgi:hypothetical protein